MQQCVVSKYTKCKHCFTKDCILKDMKFLKVIGEGVQGLVVHAIWKGKQVAVKIEMLNVYPITMTNRSDYKCDKNLQQFQDVIQAYYTKVSKAEIAKRAWIRSTQQFKKEAQKTIEFGKLNVGPKIYFAKFCAKGLETPQGVSDVGILVMEKFDMTLRDLMRLIVSETRFRRIRLQQFIHVLDELQKMSQHLSNKLIHGDVHNDNIVIQFEQNRVKKVRLIDFGLNYNPSLNLKTELEWEQEDSCKELLENLIEHTKDTNAIYIVKEMLKEIKSR